MVITIAAVQDTSVQAAGDNKEPTTLANSDAEFMEELIKQFGEGEPLIEQLAQGSGLAMTTGRSNPYGCYGQTFNPHASDHVAGTVNVQARSKCDDPMPLIFVQTQLFKEECTLIIFCDWEVYGPYGTDYGRHVRQVDTNSAGAPCENGTYKGESIHYAWGPDDVVYGSTSYKIEYVNDCT